MNGIIKFTIIAAFSILLGGCSGTSGENNSNAPTANGNTSNQVNGATVSNNNPALIPYPGTENTSGNSAANSDIKVTNIDPKQIKPTNPAMPAPDNSEMLTVLNEKGVVETRTFKSNPLLAKAQRTTVGRNVQIKLFLKNGKVIDVPAEKIENFPADSAAQILQAAGIVAPKPVQNPVQNAETGAATGAKTEDTKESKPNRPSQTPNAPPLKVPIKP